MLNSIMETFIDNRQVKVIPTVQLDRLTNNMGDCMSSVLFHHVSTDQVLEVGSQETGGRRNLT